MKTFLIGSFLLVAGIASVRACDSCGCELCEPGSLSAEYKLPDVYGNLGALNEVRPPQSYFFTGLAEQFTYYSTVRDGGQHVGNGADEWEASSITQILLGYQVNDRLTLQLNVPIIYRSFERQLLAVRQKSSVDGLGDISAHINYIAYRLEKADWSLNWSVSGGVKFPTGSTGFLNETANPAVPDSLVGGHDLTLGTGSVDGSIGTGFNLRWNKLYFTGDVDYAIRTKGADGYQYADELSWSAGPGIRAWQGGNSGLSVQLLTTGEYKGKDRLNGALEDDTGITQINVGPKIVYAHGGGLVASVGVELPVIQHNTDVQLVSDYRIKASVVLRF